MYSISMCSDGADEVTMRTVYVCIVHVDIQCVPTEPGTAPSQQQSIHPIYPAHKAGRPRSLQSSVRPSISLSVCLSVCLSGCERDGWMDGRRTGTGTGIGIVCTCAYTDGKARQGGARQGGYPSLHTDRNTVSKYRDTMEERCARPSFLYCCCCSYICMYVCMSVMDGTHKGPVHAATGRAGGPRGIKDAKKETEKMEKMRAGAGWDWGYMAGGRQQARARHT
ncbi:uncharacterized protein IWZ02DRAFT_29838 [Phyllosticta citriasiana]|uniref:uncharacterized protein n=1 Tax=Phyllosticta citriasiana TaxID=595635 RepID=UPI0030FD3813